MAPPKTENPRKCRLATSVTPQLKQKLENIARSRDRDTSYIIHEALLQYVGGLEG